MDTQDEAYADRLRTRRSLWWKRLLPTQAPYRWNLRRQHLGRTLDVGCGLGRNLSSLSPDSVGVDHNASAIEEARRSGLTAFTVEEFLSGDHARENAFDSLLIAHVIEHLSPADARGLMRTYLPFLRPGGTVFLICPQERGYASDPTHITWTTGEDLAELAREIGLIPETPRSFPFPRRLGPGFTYNEFTLRASKPAQ